MLVADGGISCWRRLEVAADIVVAKELTRGASLQCAINAPQETKSFEGQDDGGSVRRQMLSHAGVRAQSEVLQQMKVGAFGSSLW